VDQIKVGANKNNNNNNNNKKVRKKKKKAIGFASIRPRKWEDKEINVE